MVLKPQDVYVALKIVAAQADRAPYSQLAAELVMSPSEVHASVRRAVGSHLLHGPQRKNRPNFSALEEFLLHGLKYIFPPQRGELTRGVPTSYAAEPLRSMIAQGNEPSPVWPYAEGKQRGIAFEPLYKTAPIAALRDPSFYEYLALADALRDGRVRERKTAEAELCRRFREANERLKS
jgi:DNA-binding Lrp family transcriptional regulator